MPRLFLDVPLGGSSARIGEREAHYLSHVLRLKKGSEAIVFNGRGQERLATIGSLARGAAEIDLGAMLEPLGESPLEITLVQGLLKADAMDAVVQKATELGVQSILAVKTDFSVIKLDRDRAERRVGHWERIARSACEQSKRHRPPTIRAVAALDACLAALPPHGRRIAFHQGTSLGLRAVPPPDVPAVCLAVGPEGGFSAADLEALERRGFGFAGLGARVLRAETAAIAACAAAQLIWGDIGGEPR